VEAAEAEAAVDDHLIEKTQATSPKILAALNAWEKGDFEYGTRDCVSFTVFMIKELHGIDYSNELIYATEEQANEIIRVSGGFEALIDSVLGEPSEQAFSGDPVMFNYPRSGLTMGVKLNNCIVCVTKKGLTRVPERHIVRSWICQQP
jgi:hypothetical protein